MIVYNKMQIPAILNNLKQLLKININLSNLINIQINSNNTTTEKYIILEDERALSVNLSQLSIEERTRFKEILNDSVYNGVPLLEEKAKDRAEDIFLKEHSLEETNILYFFKGKIPEEDYYALRASLYLRSRFEEHASRQEIDDLKTQILQKFGKRGGNISDLCSARYFEALKDFAENSDRESFLELYEEVVGKGALTIFVSERTTPKQLTTEISKRITINRRYGVVGILQVHGIGRKNIDTIKISLDEIGETFQKISINSRLDNRVMVVTIKF